MTIMLLALEADRDFVRQKDIIKEIPDRRTLLVVAIDLVGIGIVDHEGRVKRRFLPEECQHDCSNSTASSHRFGSILITAGSQSQHVKFTFSVVLPEKQLG